MVSGYSPLSVESLVVVVDPAASACLPHSGAEDTRLIAALVPESSASVLDLFDPRIRRFCPRIGNRGADEDFDFGPPLRDGGRELIGLYHIGCSHGHFEVDPCVLGWRDVCGGHDAA